LVGVGEPVQQGVAGTWPAIEEDWVRQRRVDEEAAKHSMMEASLDRTVGASTYSAVEVVVGASTYSVVEVVAGSEGVLEDE
jgi:hypothetical protein